MAKVREDIETLIADGETLIKDGLRGARHVLRRGAMTARTSADDPVSRGVSMLARRVDGVFTLAERTALQLLRPDAGEKRPGRLIQDFPAMLCAEDGEFSRRFVETHYRLAKAVLEVWGVKNAFVSEQEIRLALQILTHRDPSLIARARAVMRRGDEVGRAAMATEFAAASALAIIRRGPVRMLAAEGREGEVPGFVSVFPSRAPFLAVALAVAGHAGRDDPAAHPDAFLASAAAIVEARYERLAACEGVAELMAEFERVMPAMP